MATLWSDPAAVRPVDAPALAPRADLAAWVSSLDPDQRMGDCVLSQLLLGERVLVEQVRPDGWARVVAVEQPAARLDPRGYPGWVPVTQVTFGAPPEPSLAVDAVETGLRDTPGGTVVQPGVALGTRLATAGSPVDGFQPVRAPGQERPLWAPPGSTAALPTSRPTPVEALAQARRLLGVAYVWGGMSGNGIDCSGLVHLSWRRLGVRLPRDANDQADATEPVPPGAEQPGDLYFFAHPGRTVHHVGFVSDRGPRHLLHACSERRQVVEEPMPPGRVATLVATHRVVSGPR